jgi:hypothetical protein
MNGEWRILMLFDGLPCNEIVASALGQNQKPFSAYVMAKWLSGIQYADILERTISP